VSWPFVAIGDVAEILSGNAWKSSLFTNESEGRLPIIRIQNISDRATDFIYWDGVALDKFIIKDGDLLLSLSGNVKLCEWSFGDAFLNQRIVKLAPTACVDKRYFYWALHRVVAEIEAMARHAVIANVSVTDLKEFQIPLPPLPEQKRIAAILDKADAIRRKRQQAIQLADDFLRAVFLDMFGDPVTNPKGWQTFTLTDVVRKDSIITYGIVQAGEHVDGGVPYIRTGDFKGGRLVRSGYACTSADIASKFKRSEVAPGDIVYCIRASVGSADVVPEFLAGANLTQGTAKISPAHDMKADFLVELLRSTGFRSWIDKNSKGATFKEITLARLREAPVFKPPMFEQEAFIRIKKIVMERLAGKFQEVDVPLFESLSQKAFSGQL
jgi:type I restriction enzyme S subunit